MFEFSSSRWYNNKATAQFAYRLLDSVWYHLQLKGSKPLTNWRFGSISFQVVHLTEKLLLKEKHIGITEVVELTKPDCNSLIDLKRSESQLSEVRQEDHSSTNSAVSSSESPHFTDGARTVSSNASELDQSDISHIEKEEVKGHHQCLELGDNSGSFDFPVEDHSFWLWPW